jgi:hypothetical protein
MEPENPYAPPRSNVEPAAAEQPKALTTRLVILMIVLSTITFGYYSIYWLYRTSRELCAELPDRGSRTNGYLVAAIVIGVVELVLLVVSFVEPNPDYQNFNKIIDLAFGITQLFWCFKVRDMLQSLVARRGVGPYPINGAGTFLFGVFYLQFKINRLPERAPSTDLDDET